MLTIRSVYLAGPDVFRPDAREHGLKKKNLCLERGVTGLFPLDGELDNQLTGKELATAICQQNMSMLRSADAIIANLSPFRGVNCDPGTAFELGAAIALGKKSAAYMCCPAGTSTDLKRRTIASFNGQQDSQGVWRDQSNLEIEDFGLAENLMLAASTKVWVECKAAGDQTELDDLAVFQSALDGLLQSNS